MSREFDPGSTATGWSLGIDFGTSNTAVSYRIGNGDPQPVELTADGFQMPSAVLLTPAGLRVGTEAVRTQQLTPEGFDDAPKLRLGQDAALLGGVSVPVVDLVAAVLGTAARKAVAAAGGTSPEHVVLTHPYEFAQARKEALRTAWGRTGITSRTVTLVSEPAAAVSHFAWVDPPAPGTSHLAVLDMGAGTCDIAVLRSTGDCEVPFEVVGHAGFDDLGGRAIDDVLRAHVFATLTARGRADLVGPLQSPRTSVELAAARTLIDQVRFAKHALTENEDAIIVVPSLPRVTGMMLTLTYEELETLTAPICARVRNLVAQTLASAGVLPGSLSKLYLTGGSSLLRPLGHAVESVLGGAPATRDNPKMVTCLGAHHVPGRGLVNRQEILPPPEQRIVPPPTSWKLIGAISAGVALLIVIALVVAVLANGPKTEDTRTEYEKLLALIPADPKDCDKDVSVTLGQAYTTCAVSGDPAVVGVEYFKFPATGLSGGFDTMVAGLGGKPETGTRSDCLDDVEVYDPDQGSGEIACMYATDESGASTPVVVWTDTRTNVLGVVNGATGGYLTDSYGWWVENVKP